MAYKRSYQSYKKSRKRRNNMPLIVLVIAMIVMIVGLFLVFISLTGGVDRIAFLTSPTPSATPTATPLPPTATATASLIPTETLTPTNTPEPTASEPFEYTVQSGDTLVTIAEQFGVDYVAIMLLNGLTNDDVLYIGDVLTIPNPDMGMPTATAIPANLARGAVIEYFVLSGDSLRSIAEEFMTTVDAIIEANEFDDPDSIYPGQIILVPVNLITPTFGPPNTPTMTPTDPNVPTASSTPAG